MFKTVLFRVQTLLLLSILLMSSGCAKHEKQLQVLAEPLPEITTAYLLEHRIIAYEPQQHEKIISTLPYEIQTFKESYLIYLIARLPLNDNNVSSVTNKAHYYLWLERRSNNWQDFVAVRSVISPLRIQPHASSIRHGHYYKEYTVDFALEQLAQVQNRDLTLLLINQQNHRSKITIPRFYIKAYLTMIAENTQ